MRTRFSWSVWAPGLLVAGLLTALVAAWAGPEDRSTPPWAEARSFVGMPSWHRVLPAADRFRLVMGDEAVLDRETGLVWERRPGTATVGWTNASFLCYDRTVGPRKGWRLPTVEELMSLVAPGAVDPSLPAGHPFRDVLPEVYWSATTIAGIAGSAYGVSLHDGTLFDESKSTLFYIWCVRGGKGIDGW